MVAPVMDLSGSDNSSDSIGSREGSFEKLWGSESALMRGLKDGSLAGLTDLVHDKDVAAKAVAFVVNSSRRGIVPLCADVAAVLRNKLKLERTIEKQRAEIQRLKKTGASLSGRTSRSTSPTHPNIEGHRIPRRPSARSKKSAESPLLSSPCSPCSSPCSPSPPHLHSLEASSASCGSLVEAPPSMPVVPHPSSPVEHDGEGKVKRPSFSSTSTSILLPNHRLVMADVHRVPSVASIQDDVHLCEPPTSTSTSSPSNDTEAVISLQQKFQGACQARAALENELARVRAELEEVRLGSKVKEGSHRDKEREETCELQFENETTVMPLSKRVRSHSTPGEPLPPMSPGYQEKHNQGLPPISPPISPRSTDVNFNSRREGLHKRSSNIESSNNNITVRLEDHVLIKGERTGYVRYLGHLEKNSSPNVVFVGLHLDAPVGKHDGMAHGIRYFWCPRSHGLFVPVNEVLAVINRKPLKRTKTAESRRKSSSHMGVGEGGGGIHHTPHTGRGREVRRPRPGQAKRLISADTLPTAHHKNREYPGSTS